MGLAIFILVVFQVLVVFNRPYLPPPPNPEREYEEMEVGTANEEACTQSPGKSKITHLLGRYSPQNFWGGGSTSGLIDISHGRNEW